MEHLHQYLHGHMAEKRAPVPDITTISGVVVSVVYVTAAPTFTGVIGGYTTLSNSDDGSQSNIQDNSAAQTSDQQNTFQASATSNSDGSILQNSDIPTGAAATGASTFYTTTPTLTNSQSNSAATGSSSSSASSSGTSSGGLSTGAKAGLAIAIIAGIGIIAALLLWFMGRKKREQESFSQADDEKTSFGAATAAAAPVPSHRHTASSVTTPNAPRLSLRPVSRMMPEFMGNNNNNKNRLSNSNMLTTMAPSGPAPSVGRNFSPSPQPRPITPQRDDRSNPNNPFNDPQNPFADPEKAMSLANQRSGPALSAPGMNSSMAAPVAAGLAAGMAGAGIGAAAMSRGPPTQKHDAPVHEQVYRAAPAPGPGPSSAPAPIVAPGPGPDSAQGNVYRVLMDFKPSMDDELELLTGQLVRLLHEYDDGWALCIRLDRSQQGVVPRTCLATKPSKPKPSHLGQYARGAGGGGSGRNSPAMGRPISPAGRPMSPSGRPMSPAGRPMSPAGRPMSPAGRPMSPAGRSMSPAGGPRGQMGPPSAGFNGLRPGPPGPPGQNDRLRPSRPMSPGAFNRAPRPLSPGPRPQPKRSMSPGPYGASGPKPMGDVSQRRRSNSASALNVRDRRNSPPGPSKLGPNGPMFRSESPGIAY